MPEALTGIQNWQAASAKLDLNARTISIQVDDTAITFTAINVNLKPHELLREINRGLVRAGAGVYVWRINPVAIEMDTVQHLYPDGQVPVLSNAHTRADVTGYALLESTPYQHTLVYVGLAAHKTSLESLWATLVRGRGGCSMRGVSVLADGENKMLAHPLSDFGIMHAGIICRKAPPGGWEAQDETAYALVFESDIPVETALQKVTLKRLQETLPFPIPDEWSKRLWEYSLDTGYIQRLETGGDCRGGVRIDLGKPWQDLVQNLLEQELLGASLEAHPLELLSEQVAKLGAITTAEAAERIGQRVTIAGLHQTSRRSRTTQGEFKMILTLEDLSGIVEVVLSPDVYRKVKDKISSTVPFLVKGTVEVDAAHNEPYIRAESVSQIM